MSPYLKITLAAGLVAILSGTAHAAPSRASHTAPHSDRAYSYESYGLDGSCANRPFAPGCDKRGVW